MKLEGVAVADVAAAVERTHPKLTGAVRRIAAEHGVPEDVIREHLGKAVLDALEKLGDRYVAEMGEMIARVDKVREHVHDFYDRVLNGELENPDPSELERSFGDLRQLILDLSDPQKWSKKITDAPRAPEAAPQPAAPAPAYAGPRQGFDVGRLAADRRVNALPAHERSALLAAGRDHPALVDAALRGDPGAAASLADAMRGSGKSADTITNALAGLSGVRDPGLTYALGGAPAAPGSTLALDPATSSGPTAAFGRLSPGRQSAIRRAAALDPDYVRSVVRSEVRVGDPRGAKVPWDPAALDAFCARNHISGADRADLEGAFRDLNKAYEDALPSQNKPVRGEGTVADPAAQRAAIQADPVKALGLPTEGQVAAELKRAPSLAEDAARSPDHFADLVSNWLKVVAEKGKDAPTLRQYVDRMMTKQVRGMLGEYTAVFRLGLDFWVLKGPDLNVTVPGTDYVVVCRRTGEVWFADNKTLSETGLSKVTSLVQNLPKNIGDDVATFGRDMRSLELPLPPEVDAGIANAAQASRAIARLTEGKTAAQIATPEVQADITRICDYYGVRRVVSNSGGELTTLGQTLADYGIAMANLEAGQRDILPEPIDTSGGTGRRTPGTGAGGQGSQGGQQ